LRLGINPGASLPLLLYQLAKTWQDEFTAVVYGSGIAPFQDNRSLLAILIDMFHCVNQSLDVDCLLPAHFLVEERFKSAHARICAQYCGSWRVSRFLPLFFSRFPPPSPQVKRSKSMGTVIASPGLSSPAAVASRPVKSPPRSSITLTPFL